MKGWEDNIDVFVSLCHKHEVRMILVGGGAVNFHGYQRHSADVDFWIDTKQDNLDRLIKVFSDMDFDITSFPNQVKNQEQNISIKFSPLGLDLELNTKCEIGKSFDETYDDAEEVEVKDKPLRRWRVLSFDDLIISKERAARPKDLLDILELKKLRSDSGND